MKTKSQKSKILATSSMLGQSKAQMKVQQMAFMLIAVTLFFVLVGMIVLVIVLSDLRGSAALLEEKNAMLLVSKLSNSPEFSCGEAFRGTRVNCIDSDKAMVLRDHIGKYSDFWGVSGIEIKKIYPAGNAVCTYENYPECNKIEILPSSSGTGVSNFVSLCRKEKSDEGIYDKCELAKIIVIYDG